jgi:hypothetical protein
MGKRFTVTLLIRHPEMDPNIITRTLQIKPQRAWKAGVQRKTPVGTILPGLYKSSTWSYTRLFKGNVSIAKKTDQLVDKLIPNKLFLLKLAAKGGQAELIIRLPGDINNGAEISWETLQKMSKMRLLLGLEVFPNWNN